ncbi:MAG TPA: transketolase, partial [Gemmatimonadales bacterium]|nr:transketolase [Gemmatimonadales bacterium]
RADTPPDLAWRSINAIRALAMDAVEQAQSGHPGTPMALAPAAYVLWTRYLRHNPSNPQWADRDRFVLSCGHASMLLYSVLHLSGYDLPLAEIKNFRQWGSMTPGHPERGHTPGVETTTGPLGQGMGNAVGMAIAERFLGEHFNRPDHPLVDHRVWAFASDGDLMEGVTSEVASLAGHLQLGKLKVVYDDNHITIDGDTALTFSEDVPRRFEAYGWHVVRVSDGNDLAGITAALEAARAETTRPSLVVLRTTIADPAPTKRNTAEAHGAPLGAEEVRRTKEIMGWPLEPKFFVPEDALNNWRGCVSRGAELESVWRKGFEAYARSHPVLAAEFEQWLAGDLPDGWDKGLPIVTPAAGQLATRQASGLALQAIASAVPNLVGGSADLGGSTGTTLKQGGTFGPTSSGRTFHWGVREHGMAACLNGMAAHGGVRPFGSTFLVFSDYMKPAIRLAAIMRLPVIYIGTHDSIGLGEDGPTHQPVEHLAMLRAIPNLVTLRPADATETIEAWRVAMERRDGPTMLVLTRQKLPVLDRQSVAAAEGTKRGAYVLLDPPPMAGQSGPGRLDSILIATGSEVMVALGAAKLLQAEGINARVVSMPSWELFAAQPESYRDKVLPPDVRARVAVEAAGGFGWSRWTTAGGVMLGMEGFGASAPGERLFQEFKFTPERVAEAAKQLLSRRSR